MERPHLKVTTKAQFEKLIELMEKNPEIARGKPRFGMSRNVCKDLWEGFAVELNSLGPPTRTSSEWQRVWIHYKASTKKKLANNKRNMQATGGGPSQEIPLNSLENCVSVLLSLNEQVEPSGQFFGVENISPTTCNGCIESSETTTHPPAVPPKTPIRRRNSYFPEKERLELLKKQTETQAELLKTIKSLEKTAYKNYEVKKHLLKIKQRKIALYESQINQATELHNLRMECEKMKIEKLRYEMQM